MSVTVNGVETPPKKEAVWERSGALRFPIETSLNYKLVGAETLSRVGRGRTIEISSKAITFACDGDLPEGAAVELYIEWPSGLAQISLVACGRLTCGDRAATTVEIARYEFRTRGAGALDSVNLFDNVGREAPDAQPRRRWRR
jgi:hypothetical protein